MTCIADGNFECLCLHIMQGINLNTTANNEHAARLNAISHYYEAFLCLTALFHLSASQNYPNWHNPWCAKTMPLAVWCQCWNQWGFHIELKLLGTLTSCPVISFAVIALAILLVTLTSLVMMIWPRVQEWPQTMQQPFMALLPHPTLTVLTPSLWTQLTLLPNHMISHPQTLLTNTILTPQSPLLTPVMISPWQRSPWMKGWLSRDFNNFEDSNANNPTPSQ